MEGRGGARQRADRGGRRDDGKDAGLELFVLLENHEFLVDEEAQPLRVKKRWTREATPTQRRLAKPSGAGSVPVNRLAQTRKSNIEPMNYNQFIKDQVEAIKQEVGDGIAINALSGGRGQFHRHGASPPGAGRQLKTIFVENALMREGEPERVVKIFASLGIQVELIDARRQFLKALKGLTDPEEKRQAITDTFYKDVFGKAVKRSRAKYLFHGTILTDIEETVAGIKRQHNILAQIGIDPEKTYGYKVIEPLQSLRKDGVRQVARRLGLPSAIAQRMPFPGPALAARIVGEVTEARLATVRAATAIVEEELAKTRRLPVPGSVVERLRYGHSERQTGVRSDHRGALHRQHRRPRGYRARAALENTTPPHPAHYGYSGREPLSLRPDAQAARHGRIYLRPAGQEKVDNWGQGL